LTYYIRYIMHMPGKYTKVRMCFLPFLELAFEDSSNLHAAAVL